MKINKILGAAEDCSTIFCELDNGTCFIVNCNGEYDVLPSIATFFWRCTYPPVFVSKDVPEVFENLVNKVFDREKDTEKFKNRCENAKFARDDTNKNITDYENRILDSGKEKDFKDEAVEQVMGYMKKLVANES